MITENDLFGLQKSIIYCFRNIPEYSSRFLDILHDTLYELGGIKTLNYNDIDMTVFIDIMTDEPKMEIFKAINDSYIRTVNECIQNKYVDSNTEYLTTVDPQIINAVLPICCTILDLSISKDSLVFRVNLHN